MRYFTLEIEKIQHIKKTHVLLRGKKIIQCLCISTDSYCLFFSICKENNLSSPWSFQILYTHIKLYNIYSFTCIYTYTHTFKNTHKHSCIYLRVLLDFRGFFFNDLENTIGQKNQVIACMQAYLATCACKLHNL